MGLFNSIRLGSSAAGDYEIKRSLRVNDDDSAYLSRTPSSAGNRRTFTISLWTKRANLTGALFGSYNSDADRATLRFTSDYLEFQSSGASVKTNAVFRDPSAWYHIVCAIDTTQGTQSNRGKLYVNGVQQELSSNNFSQDVETSVNNNSLQVLGTRWASDSANMLYDGYLAEIHLIDGSALTPSSFAETDDLTGEYKPKKYIGSYGTNGFYLNFSDNSGTSSTTLGKDSSGNGNNWTPNNFSVSAGAGNDSLEDTPTKNFPTINPLAGHSTNFVSTSNGNLDFSLANNHWAISSFKIPDSGKWYAECVFTDVQSGDFGVFNPNMINDDSNGFDGRWNGIRLLNGGSIAVDNSTVQSSLTAITNNDIVGVKIDRDAGTIAFTINGSANGSAVNISSFTDSSVLTVVNRRNSSSGSNPIGSQNYGQRSFSHLPAGYKALCSANLPDPTIAFPNKHFGTLLWTGNATVRTISDTSAVDFTPDMVWVKCRSASHDHQLTDSVRGTSKALPVNTNGQEVDWDTAYSGANKGMGDYVNGGFGLDDNGNNARYNANSQTYVAWNWKGGGSASSNTDGSITSSVSANTSAGFSVLTYTGTGSQTTVGHGLGVKPKVIITKLRDTNTQDWFFYPKQLTGTGGTYIKFNETATVATDAHTYPNVEPTSTVYTVGGDDGGDGTNGNGKAYVAYCWSEVANFSKFDTYAANGNADGVFVYTGFRPALVIFKNTSSTEAWSMFDNTRDPYNPVAKFLRPSGNNTDTSGSNDIDFLSNGFKARTGNNPNTASGHKYIYLAFAESPFKYSRAR